MKKLFCIFTAITVLFSLCIKAGATESGDTNKEDTETVQALLNKTFELYLLKYRGFAQSSEYVSLPPDKYHENELSKKLTSEGVSKFYALNEDCDTRRKLVSKVSVSFSESVSSTAEIDSVIPLKFILFPVFSSSI